MLDGVNINAKKIQSSLHMNKPLCQHYAKIALTIYYVSGEFK